MNWGGGVDFLTTNVMALLASYNPKNMQLTLLLPEKKFRPFSRIPCFNHILFKKNTWLLAFKKRQKEIKFAFSRFGQKSVNRSLNKLKADVALFCWSDLVINSYDIGYYPDLQHKYFPEFFTKHERQQRDQTITHILQRRKALIVNAKAVKQDLKKFYPKTNCEIFSLPFAPFLLDHTWLDPIEVDVKAEYGIRRPYFLISNQFWIHKSHQTAFDAFKMLLTTEIGKGIDLVCTGKVEDYRFPDYPKQLLKSLQDSEIKCCVHILGHIPKRKQIELMKHAIAVIQPTLFEGGPGGGCVYNALCLGIPVIVSDIPTNKEISGEGITFFKTKDSYDLYLKMLDALKKEPFAFTNKYLLEKSASNIKKVGQALLDIINLS